jgi:hypothetical protein
VKFTKLLPLVLCKIFVFCKFFRPARVFRTYAVTQGDHGAACVELTVGRASAKRRPIECQARQ